MILKKSSSGKSGLCLRGFLAAIVLVFHFCGMVFATDAKIKEVRSENFEDKVRIVIELDEEVRFTFFTLSEPNRVVLDLKNASSRINFRELQSIKPVKGLRSALRENGSLRVVLDVDGDIAASKAFVAQSRKGNFTLFVDVPRSNETAGISFPGTEADESKRDVVVAISAGHGGNDPGGIGYDGKLQEKDITLDIARQLYDYLEILPGFSPIMIRDDDVYVKLQRRSQIAREHRSDLFVAIHTDWYKSSLANGLTIYALSGDRADRENARRVAEKENSSDLIGGIGNDIQLDAWDDDVALTLVSLQMSWSMEQSLEVGTHILDSVNGITKLRRDKVQQASLEVLKSPDIPSILIEAGYLTNPNEARKLNSPSFQKSLAAGIGRGIRSYFYDKPPEGSLVAWQKKNGVAPSTYVVRRGDSLSLIAKRFGFSIGDIRIANKLRTNLIQIGQVLHMPAIKLPKLKHKVSGGETLSQIAQTYGVSLGLLREKNALQSDLIRVGQILHIPQS